MAKDSPYGDWRVVPLKGVLVLFGWARPIWSAFYTLFMSISPSIPIDLRRATGAPRLAQLFWCSYAIAFSCCFLLTAGICFIEGTLIGTDTSRRYFLQDGWNIVLYVAICPTYVGLCCCLIATSIHEWGTLADYADQTTGSNVRTRSTWRVYLVFLFALLLCTIFITNYIYDILNQTPAEAATARVYWFMKDLGGGLRTLNRVGYYYVCLNFALLFMVLIGAACFLNLAAEVLRCGRASEIERIDDFDTLQVRLAAFTRSYILVKGLVACLALNTFIWAQSPLGTTDNLFSANLLLTLVGVFFVAVPRQYVELKWYELWQRSGREFTYSDSRPWRIKATAGFLDAFFITSLLSVWHLDAGGLVEYVTRWLN